MYLFKQHLLLQELDQIAKEYAGMFVKKGGRRFTIKYTNSKPGGTKKPYLYSWVYFKPGETVKYSEEKGEFIYNTNPNSKKGRCQSVYICPANEKHSKYFEYNEYARGDILDSIELIQRFIQTQIKLIDRTIRMDEFKNGYKFNDLNYDDQLKKEDEIQKELNRDHKAYFQYGIDDIKKIKRMVDEDMKTRESVLQIIQEKKEVDAKKK